MTCQKMSCCTNCGGAVCGDDAFASSIVVDDICCEAIAFIGSVLAPFFLEDPKNGKAGASFVAIGSLSSQEAATEWPFVDSKEAQTALSLMVDGVVDSISKEGEFRANDDLVWEYRRLFVGPGKKPVPPWGSVYTDRDKVIFGASTLALNSWMREHNIKRQQNDGMPNDHIGLMLALMATLSVEHPECLGEYLRDHLLTWSSHYLKQLEAEAQHSFYQGLALLTRLSLEGIQENLDIQVTYPRFYR